MKTCSTALRTSDWCEGSPSNRTSRISTQPRQQRSCFGTSLWMSLSGCLWMSLRSLERPENSCAATLPVHSERASEDLQRRMGETPQYRCAKHVASYPRRLEAVIVAKGASTKYWVKGLNTFVNVIFEMYIFYKYANISKNVFLLCRYGVLHVDLWGTRIFNAFLNKAVR